MMSVAALTPPQRDYPKQRKAHTHERDALRFGDRGRSNVAHNIGAVCLQHTGQQRVALRKRRRLATGGRETTGGLSQRALYGHGIRIAQRKVEVHVELPSTRVLRDAIVVVRARKQQIHAVGQSRPDGEALPLFRAFVAQGRQGIEVEIDDLRKLGNCRHPARQDAPRNRNTGDIGCAGQIDLGRRWE